MTKRSRQAPGGRLAQAFDRHERQNVPGPRAAKQGPPDIALFETQALLACAFIHEASGPHDFLRLEVDVRGNTGPQVSRQGVTRVHVRRHPDGFRVEVFCTAGAPAGWLADIVALNACEEQVERCDDLGALR